MKTEAVAARGAGNYAGGSPSKASTLAPRQRKKLSGAEKRSDKGRFATQLNALLEERGWDHHKLAERMDLGEAAVRRWLRAEVLPGDLEIYKALGRALDTAECPFPDYRLVLPPPK